jgi:hypothetical protein
MTKDLLDFICRLEGYKTNVKNLHWAASNLTVHMELDDILDELSDFEDNVAEDAQAIYGQITVGDVYGISSVLDNPVDLLIAIRADLANMKDLLTDKMYVGIINEVEDYWHKVNIRIYRMRQALKG